MERSVFISGMPSEDLPTAPVIALLTLRAVLLAVIVGLISVSHVIGHMAQMTSSVSMVVAATVLFTGASVLWLRHRRPTFLFTLLQMVVDSLGVTALVYLTGGPLSPCLFLYLPVVMASAILLSRRVAFALTLWNIVLYTALVMLLDGGMLPTFDGMPLQSPRGGILLQMVGLISGMVLVGVASNFLAHQMRRSRDIANRSQAELSQVTERHHGLLDELPDAIITTRADGAITQMNRASHELFAGIIAPDDGRAIQHILADYVERGELPATGRRGPLSGGRELELMAPDRNATLRLLVAAHAYSSPVNPLTTTMYVFRDVTRLRSLEEQINLQERMARLLADRSAPLPLADHVFADFVGSTPVMQKIFELLQRVARSEATVLVTGESGTGKELAARAVHTAGPRGQGPFVAVNCGAIPESLLESELFGHMKGSFTGAIQDSLGLFRQADGGTIFLDEIGELPLHLQAKLLRVVQERVVLPVGGRREIPVNLRIVAATNRTLRDEVRRGKFREDLFFRLNVISIRLPPLRERREDIPLLTNAIIRKIAPANVSPVVSPQAMQMLLAYSYPGNVRELENIIERALVLGGDVILPEHLPGSMRGEPSLDDATIGPAPSTTVITTDDITLPIQLDGLLESIERRYLLAALHDGAGIKKRAAKLLGMNFRSFRYRLQKFGIESEGEEGAEGEQESDANAPFPGPGKGPAL